VYRAHRDSTRPRFEVRELGEIDMVSRARAALDLVTNDQLSYGELAGLAGLAGALRGLIS